MKYLCSLLCLTMAMQNGRGQQVIARDPEIVKMVAEINRDSLHSYVQSLVHFGTRHTLSGGAKPGRGIGASTQWVLAKFNACAGPGRGRMRVEAEQWVQAADGKRVDSSVTMTIPLAILSGTDTTDKRILLISAHLDSRASGIMNRLGDAPGANDDASGVAAVIECARVLSAHAFPITIVFAIFSGEEQGLLGSAHLAQKATDEHWSMLAILNNDIIGGNNQNQTESAGNTRVRIFSEGIPYGISSEAVAKIRMLGLENDGQCRQLARYIKETGERYVDNMEVVMIYRNDRFLRGGDQNPWVENGFPAVRMTEMNENYDHQHQDVTVNNGPTRGDLPEFMDFEYLRKNTAINLAVLASLAKAPAPPTGLTMDLKQLSNSTGLRWNPATSDKTAGYYVLMRETTASQWQKKIFTSSAAMELPYSKDNYQFGVQAVGKDGNLSLPVVPGFK